MGLAGLLCREHVAFDVEACDGLTVVGVDGDDFSEPARVFVFAVVGYFYFASGSGRDVVFRVVGYGASAGGVDVVDHEFCVAHVLELEDYGVNRVVLSERAEVDGGLFELYLRFFLGCGCGHEADRHDN